MKLAKLTEGKNKTVISKAAGLPATAISNYLRRDYVPRADTALKIARALGVSVEWLADEKATFPPPPPADKPSPASFSDGELMSEVMRRRQLAFSDLLGIIEHAERVDWASIRRRLSDSPDQIPSEISRDALLVYKVFTSYARALGQFDCKMFDQLYLQIPVIPGRNEGELDQDRITERYENLQKNADFTAIRDDIENRKITPQLPEKIEQTAWINIIRIGTGDVTLTPEQKDMIVGKAKDRAKENTPLSDPLPQKSQHKSGHKHRS